MPGAVVESRPRAHRNWRANEVELRRRLPAGKIRAEGDMAFETRVSGRGISRVGSPTTTVRVTSGGAVSYCAPESIKQSPGAMTRLLSWSPGSAHSRRRGPAAAMVGNENVP